MTLLPNKPFLSKNGVRLPFKIECDAFTDEDLQTLARRVSEKFTFGDVMGVPRGGLRFAAFLKQLQTPGANATLVVDDVFTTGKSMEDMRAAVYGMSVGVVIFAWVDTPSWVYPIFQAGRWVR